MIKATTFSVYKKQIEFDTSKKYYKNGEFDLYSEEQALLIKNSVTAKTGSSIMCQYLIGDGYGEIDTMRVDEKGTKFYKLASKSIKSKVNQRGIFFHVMYNAAFEKTAIKVIPFEQCRIGKKDDEDYNGKILYSKDFHDKKEKVEVLDVYNTSKEVIESQVRKASGNKDQELTVSDWNKYKGQILYINDDDEYIYPDSRIHAVQKDCDSEAKSSTYKNRSLNNGFFGKTIFITPPLIDDDLGEYVLDSEGKTILNPKYREAETERDKFKNTVESFFGSENQGDGMLMETDFDGEDLDKAFIVKNIDPNVNDKLFEYTEKSVRRNILFAFNNLPVMLVEPSEGVFSASGESFAQAQTMYWRNNKQERSEIEAVLTELFTNFKGENYTVTTKSIFDDNNALDKP